MSQFRVIFSDPRFGGVTQRLTGRSAWIYKLAFAMAALVVILPLLLLILAGIFTFVLFLAAGTLVDRIANGLQALLAPRPRRDELLRPEDSGRVNVRVIRPEEKYEG